VSKVAEKRTLEITASVSAVIPTGNYENYKPMYSVKEIVETDGNGNANKIISERTDELRSLLKIKLDEDYERLRIERIKQQRQDIRFYKRGNKQYPSVTSIISAIEPIQYDPDKLKQYASRGNIVHAQINHFFKAGKWETDIFQIPHTKLDYLIVTQGSLKLKWDDCNFMGFWEKYSKDFEPLSEDGFDVEVEIYNDEYFYAGRADFPCKYKGVPTLADFKTASTYDNAKMDKYFRQVAAYAQQFKGIKQLMIIPLNPSNKTGFGQPLIETDVDRYFTLFLQDRSAFKTIYGI
jgi:hypothetical protein